MTYSRWIIKKIDFWWFSWIEKYGGAIDVMCREKRETGGGGGGGVLRISCASALRSLFSWLHQRHSSGLSQLFLLCLCLSREPLMLHLRHRCSGKRRKSKGFSKYISLWHCTQRPTAPTKLVRTENSSRSISDHYSLEAHMGTGTDAVPGMHWCLREPCQFVWMGSI